MYSVFWMNGIPNQLLPNRNKSYQHTQQTSHLIIIQAQVVDLKKPDIIHIMTKTIKRPIPTNFVGCSNAINHQCYSPFKGKDSAFPLSLSLSVCLPQHLPTQYNFISPTNMETECIRLKVINIIEEEEKEEKKICFLVRLDTVCPLYKWGKIIH